MIGHARIPYRPQVDGIKGTQLLKTIFRHHAPGFDVGLATPIEVLPCE